MSGIRDCVVVLVVLGVLRDTDSRASSSEGVPSISAGGSLGSGSPPTTQDSGRRTPVLTTAPPVHIHHHHPLHSSHAQHLAPSHPQPNYSQDSGGTNSQPSQPPLSSSALSEYGDERISEGYPDTDKDLRETEQNTSIASEAPEIEGQDVVPGSKKEEMTTIVNTTMPNLVSCQLNLTGPEGYVEAPSPSTTACSYTITLYLGYGVEVQVMDVLLSEEDRVMFEDVGDGKNTMLANESILMRGLVVRSHSNQIAIHFHSNRSQPGFIQLRYRAFVLSCVFPQRPLYGDVSVNSLHSGGEAFFFCLTGYLLQGPSTLTCLNASIPYWSRKEPHCVAACGQSIKNVTVGRIVSPGFPSNYSNNLTCHWQLEAPAGQRLHIHFEKVALAEDDDRLLIKNGNSSDSAILYDSYEVEYLPNEGLLSTSRHLFIELTTDTTGTSTGIAIRYQAFAAGHCYQPFLKYGNLTSTDNTWAVGAVVEFICNPGYTLEQGSVTIECLDMKNPQWNETEPACRAVCSGDITDSAGVVLSPNWPESYDKGQDCIWGIHVEEDKRIMLDIQVLNIGKNDLMTVYDGDDLTARVLAQYSSSKPHFKLYTSTADVTIQFQSDPATNVYGYGNGFVVYFFEVARNDTCPELPEIINGWKSSSQPELVQGTVVTYHCYPGHQLLGSELLMCQWDLTWSGDIPTCDRVLSCADPGLVDHSMRVLSVPSLIVGSSIQYFCNKGFVLSGNSLLTCFSRGASKPHWNRMLPRCLPESSETCRHPGTPSYGTPSSHKAHFLPGEELHYSCMTGHQLLGEPVLHCIPGPPSKWSGLPPVCKSQQAHHDEHRREAVFSADLGMDGAYLAFAVFLSVILLLILGIYLYFSKIQRKPLQFSTNLPYKNIPADPTSDSSGLEAAETREYEVSI